MTIKTDKVIIENGADFTFVCRKIPFAISCSDLHHGDTNLIDLDLVNKMRIPLRNVRVTRMSLLGHDVRAVGRIKQTVQCVVNGRVQGCVHLEGKVIRDLFSVLNVDCLASSKTYERLMGRKPPDPGDEGYMSTEDIPTLGDEEDDDKKEETEDVITKDHRKTEEEVPPDPPDAKNPSEKPLPTLQLIQCDNMNYLSIEYPDKENDTNKEDKINVADPGPGSLYEHFEKYGPGPRDLQEIRLNSMKDDHDDDEHELYCELCFREGKPIKIVTSHGNRCPTCPSLTPTQKERILGPYWKQQAEMIFKMRYNKEKERE